LLLLKKKKGESSLQDLTKVQEEELVVLREERTMFDLWQKKWQKRKKN